MIRRFGDRPITGQKYIMRPGTYAILPLEHQLLLTHHCLLYTSDAADE